MNENNGVAGVLEYSSQGIRVNTLLFGVAAAFLLSGRSAFITGSTMFVDGGMCL